MQSPCGFFLSSKFCFVSFCPSLVSSITERINSIDRRSRHGCSDNLYRTTVSVYISQASSDKTRKDPSIVGRAQLTPVVLLAHLVVYQYLVADSRTVREAVAGDFTLRQKIGKQSRMLPRSQVFRVPCFAEGGPCGDAIATPRN